MINAYLEKDEKPAFVRQIQDYYKYSALGSTWMIINIEFQNLDINKFEQIYFGLLYEQNILRSVFIRKDNGLIIRKVLPISLFDYKIFRIKSYNEIAEFFESFHKEFRFNPLSTNLSRLFIFNYKGKSYVFICINHIICDRQSIDKIRDQIIAKYRNIDYTFNFYDFDKFSELRNTTLFNKFSRDYSFFKKKFNHSCNNDLDNVNLENWIEGICKKNYSYYLDNKTPIAFDTLIKLPINYLTFNIKSLIIYALLEAQKLFFGKNKSVGFLFRDIMNPNFDDCIGQLTGEGSISYDFTEENSKESIINVINRQLLNSYRRPIFNYSMYDMDELYLEKNDIHIFLNYNKFSIDYPVSYSYNARETFYNSPTVKSFIEPNIIFYQNGYLLCRWIFDENKISKHDMIHFKNLFNKQITNLTDYCSKIL